MPARPSHHGLFPLCMPAHNKQDFCLSRNMARTLAFASVKKLQKWLLKSGNLEESHHCASFPAIYKSSAVKRYKRFKDLRTCPGWDAEGMRQAAGSAIFPLLVLHTAPCEVRA